MPVEVESSMRVSVDVLLMIAERGVVSASLPMYCQCVFLQCRN